MFKKWFKRHNLEDKIKRSIRAKRYYIRHRDEILKKRKERYQLYGK